MRSRALCILFLFAIVWLALLSRAAYLQIWPQDQLNKLQERQFETVIKLQPRRGDILDREGKDLASSITMYSLYADPKLIKNPRHVARKIAQTLGLNRRSVYRKLKKKNRFVWIARRQSKRVKEKISKWNIRGLGFIEESKRVYPNGTLLSHVLGFVGKENQGLSGLEYKFHEVLTGKKRTINFQKDARGRPLLRNGRVFTQKPGGANVHLTIDLELQYYLERELEKAVEESEAKGATGIVLDAQTSEILAMGSLPMFNPNYPLRVSSERRRNRAISEVYEPGSTLKAFIAALLLKDTKAQPNTSYYCEDGEFRIGRLKIKESSKKHKWKWLTLSQILAVSSNIGISKVAFDLGGKRVESGLRAFGLGEPLGIELGGEEGGIIPKRPWRKHHLATISFGQGIATTALQVANGYASIANGGLLMRPFLVKKIENSETKEYQEFKPVQIRRVLPENVASQMRMMLAGITSGTGTGAAARVPGYVVAGKTGTAQKVDLVNGGYLEREYIASFAGFIPANKPKYVIYVMVDRPHFRNHTGGSVAAPIFSRVASFLAQRSGMPPILITKDDLIERRNVSRTIASEVTNDFKREIRKGIMPDMKGFSIREVIRWMRSSEYKVEFIGEGHVKRTVPLKGQKISKTNKVKIYFE